MQIVQLKLNDTLYNDIIKKGIDIQEVMKETLNKITYAKEHKIANDINQSIQDVKAGNSKPISELFSEL